MRYSVSAFPEEGEGWSTDWAHADLRLEQLSGVAASTEKMKFPKL